EAVATLFDSRKMKSGGIRDRLKEVGIIQIIIGSGNCRMLPNRQSGNRLREGVTEIGVLGAAAVPSPPTSVQSELREVCEPSFAAGSGRRAAQIGRASCRERVWIGVDGGSMDKKRRVE